MQAARRVSRTLVLAAAAAVTLSATAAEGPPQETPPVSTRAEVRSFLEEPGGKFYVRLKLVPRARIPFTTQTFRVLDRSLLDGIREGASVRFTSRHLAGENTVTSMQLAKPCRRFSPCE